MNENNSNKAFEENLRVMPKEFYGDSGPQKGYNMPSSQTPLQSAKVKTKKKTKKIKTIVFIIFLLIMIGLSGWFLYLSYFVTVQESQAPIPTPEIELTPELEEVEQEEILPEEQEEESVVEEEEPQNDSFEFVPADISSTTLQNMPFVDTDKDGLSDDEEFLFGLDPNNPDTDDDGYSDSQELLALYNPAGVEPVAIEFSGLVTTYVNPTYDYNVFYPKKWIAKAVDHANTQIYFTSALGEFVTVLVEENLGNLSLIEWYLEQVPGLTEDQIKTFTNKNDLQGIMSPDGFTAYFVKGRFIYVLHYNVGLKEIISYPNVFAMMIQSFAFTGQN